MFDWIGACATGPTVLPLLEPVAGLGLALGLAYLNLEKFRYRSQIRDKALKALEQLKVNGSTPEIFGNSPAYARIKTLAALPDNNENDQARQQKANVPDGFWNKTYRHLFEFHKDKNIVIFTSVASAVVLIVGVALQVGQLTFLECIFSPSIVKILFWVLAFSVMFPMALVRAGNKVVESMWKLIDSDTKELNVPLVVFAQNAKSPEKIGKKK
jgi:hypothetical protein